MGALKLTVWITLCLTPGTPPPVEKAVEIDAPVAVVWEALTAAEHARQWNAPHLEIDLRAGGALRVHRDPKASIGAPGTAELMVLTFEPRRLLSHTLPSPPGRPDDAGPMFVNLHLEELGPRRTRIRSVVQGFGAGEAALRDRLAAAEPELLHRLKAHCEQVAGDGADDAARRAAATLAEVRRLVGGDWIHEAEQPDGSLFRVRNVLRDGPDGAAIVSSGWLGNQHGMFHHAATLIWREPVTRAVRFRSVDQNGAVAGGGITLDADGRRLIWDWASRTLDGDDERYRIEMEFLDDDRYRSRIEQVVPDGARRLVVDAEYERVDEAPPPFQRILELAR